MTGSLMNQSKGSLNSLWAAAVGGR